MKQDLIFHLIPKRKWRECQQGGVYKLPEEETEQGWIRCYRADEVNDAANRLFGGRKQILLLVIHSNRLSGRLRFEEREEGSVPLVESGINLDAIIDKIMLDPDEEGRFDIRIESD